MNPSVDPAEIEAEYAKDPESAAAEYGAAFRGDISSFLDIETLRDCVDEGIHEREIPIPDRTNLARPSNLSREEFVVALQTKDRENLCKKHFTIVWRCDDQEM
jgi:hypothetical protein